MFHTHMRGDGYTAGVLVYCGSLIRIAHCQFGCCLITTGILDILMRAQFKQKAESSVGYGGTLRPVTSTSTFSSFSWFYVAVNPMSGFRIGEASNPGPWSVELRNIVSAHKHLEDLHFHQHCIAWTETSATKQTQERAVRKVRQMNSHVIFSAPATSSQQGTRARGKPEAMGTMIFSRHHVQNLETLWDPAIFRTARVADATIQIGVLQIRVILVYGYHSGISDSNAKNDRLLAHAFARANDFQMPAIILGDFNCDLQNIPCWARAQSMGFVDIAARFASLHGEEPDNTYKGESRLDYIICNNLAAPACCSLAVDPKGYTDHAILTAEFDWNAGITTLPTWHVPFDVAQLEQIQEYLPGMVPPQHVCDAFWHALNNGTVTDAFRTFCTAFEEKVNSTLVQVSGTSLAEGYKGRGRGKLVLRGPSQVYVSKDGHAATDRIVFKQRLKVVDRINELIFLMTKDPLHPRRAQLWYCICSATGFKPSFPEWLLENDVALWIPLAAPPLEWLLQVKQALAWYVGHWTRLLDKQRRNSVSNTFAADWKKGGKLHAAAIKQTNYGVLDSLVKKDTLDVRLMKAHKQTLAKFHISDPGKVAVGASWDFGAVIAKVKAVDGHVVTLSKAAVDGMCKNVVTQRSWTTDTNFIAQEIAKFWNGYWNTALVPCPQTMEQVTLSIPQLPEFDANITPTEIQEILCRIPKKKARGMDGWSNSELRCLSMVEIDMLAALFNRFTIQGEWPKDLLLASVALLAKVSFPETAKDGRPITILATVYRLYAKIMAQKMLKSMLGHLPKTLLGSVPHCSTSDAAWELQARFEESMYQSEEGSAATGIAGVSLDLSKAYNTIPRQLVAMLARRCGWPEALVKSYMNFLNGLTRFFKIHQGLHQPTTSNTGVPEGDPIAVPVMIMVTWGVTNTMAESGGDLVSYVDNWTLLCRDVGHLCHLLEKIKHTTGGLALILNPSKTLAFATTEPLRRQLKQIVFGGSKLNVTHTTCDLGVTFQTVHRPTSQALAERLRSNEPNLQKLQMMPWSFGRKASMIHRVVAPSVLYGVAFASTSLTFMSQMRGKFSSAIFGKFNKRNHFLGPLFGVGSHYEPYLMIFNCRLHCVRRAERYDSISTLQRWDRAMTAVKSFGPFRYLFEHVQIIGWKPFPGGLVQTHSGDFLNFFREDIVHLRARALSGWWQFVCNKLHGRQDFQFLGITDIAFTNHIRRRAAFPLAQIGCFTAGAVLFSEQKIHFMSQEDSVCRHCGQCDTQNHRLFHCPGYAHCRSDIQVQNLMQLPVLQNERGLFRKPWAIHQWENRCRAVEQLHFPTFFYEHVSLFTDGSTIHGQAVACSTWALILAEPGSSECLIVEKGFVQGEQNNYRAELYAVLAALQHATEATVFIDNQAVVFGMWRLQSTAWQEHYWSKQAEYNLWSVIWSVFSTRKTELWRFVHVVSHRELCSARDDVDAWCIVHNRHADEAAKSVHRNLSTVERALLLRANAEHARVLSSAKDIFLLQQRILQASSMQTTVKPTELHCNVVPAPRGLPWTLEDQVDNFSNCLLCPPFLRMLRDFMARDWQPCTHGFSLLQLYMYFVSKTGWVTPVNIGSWDQTSVPIQWQSNAPSAWVHETSYPALSFVRPTMSKQLTIFLHALKLVLRRHDIPFVVSHTTCLQLVGHSKPVASLSHVPLEYNDADIQAFKTNLSHDTVTQFLRKRFDPKLSPLAGTVAQEHPRIIWNRYFAVGGR